MFKYYKEMIIIGLLVWVTVIQVKQGKVYDSQDEMYEIISKNCLTDNGTVYQAWDYSNYSGFDAMPFQKAFELMYNTYGEGHLFDWRDKEYTTNLKKEGDSNE